MQYIQLRKTTYHFRYKIPLRFRAYHPCGEIRRSLKTDCYSVAVALVAAKFPVINQINYMTTPQPELKALLEELASFPYAQQPTPLTAGLRSGHQSRLRQAQSSNQEISLFESAYLLEDAWADFCRFKDSGDKPRNPKIVADQQRKFDFMRLYWGNRDVLSITKKDIKALLQRYSETPVLNKSPFNKMSLKEVLSVEVPHALRIGSKSVAELLKVCQSFFSTYLTKERDLFDVSPTANVKWIVEGCRYSNLSDTEARLIERAACQREGWEKWLLLLGLYTGARRAEIACLDRSSILKDDDSGRWYIWIASGKSEAASRSIPIHHRLIELGLLDFVKSRHGLLFPEVATTNKNAIIKLFHQVLVDQGIAPENKHGERKVFHSLRHTFVTKVLASGVSLSLLQSVVGHEMHDAGITKRYTHQFAVKDLLEAVDVLKF